ncbi:MAG: preprotein translocase subunit SecD [Parcubacteria group bacterium Gr01-1014_66]|nr:MAG: preprotein translocase subunit SecD [Parcubacteria group bacterium Gr01-1014_66]
MALSSGPSHKKPYSAWKKRILFVSFIFAALILALCDVPKLLETGARHIGLGVQGTQVREWIGQRFTYRLGLDIQGGTHLVYRADMSRIDAGARTRAIESVRDVIERRINLFGVAEPLVQTERSGGEWRLVVELAGVRNIQAAIQLIGETPFIDFREERVDEARDLILAAQKKGQRLEEDPYFVPTALTGRFIKGADVAYVNSGIKPAVSLVFNEEGAKLFAELTRRNKDKRLGIYLDGVLLTAPVVQEEITEGRAQVTGDFTIEAARELADRLNAGALEVPITLIGQQLVGASLGQESLSRTLSAGIIGFLLVAIFMIGWYRLPGFIAVFALLFYIGIILLIFQVIPITLTVAGITGFILSMGMAVDANVLIFERMKEELRRGRDLSNAVEEGFRRAWSSIRDSNISSLITTGILYWLGTGVVQGFAFTLAIGIGVSIFSAITITRTLLRMFIQGKRAVRMRALFLSGFMRLETVESS